MKLIVGLGNPGRKYAGTRHNVGFMVLDRLVEQAKSVKRKAQNNNLKFKTNKKLESEVLQIGGMILAKPQTFMNKSGVAVRKIIISYKLQVASLYVVHDDLDIRLGRYKIQLGRGPKDHRGVLSVERELGDRGFWRVRVGIDNRPVGGRDDGESYTLERFRLEEKKVVDIVVREVADALAG